MTEDYREIVTAWIAKSRSDQASASLRILGREPHLDTGSYHCQQAAEKALKGWLTAHQVEFRKTHDLGELLHQCIELHDGFDSLQGAVSFLVPFATQFRYPGDIFEPPPEEALEALDHASKVIDAVVANLKAVYPGEFASL